MPRASAAVMTPSVQHNDITGGDELCKAEAVCLSWSDAEKLWSNIDAP